MTAPPAGERARSGHTDPPNRPRSADSVTLEGRHGHVHPAPPLAEARRASTSPPLAEARRASAAGRSGGTAGEQPDDAHVAEAVVSAPFVAERARSGHTDPPNRPRSTDPVTLDAQLDAQLDEERDDQHGHVAVDTVLLSAELAGEAGAVASAEAAEYALWLGDDALILAQQLGAWISRAPELEEDVALGNIALDLIGHARSLLHYAGTATGRSEDDLAYWRDEPEWRSAWLFEQPNGDFAHTIARQLAASVYLFELYAALSASTDATLAAIAAKAVKEVDYHRDHAAQWVLRLAQGTAESRRRMLIAVDDIWPYVDELFRDEPLIDRLPGVAVRPSTLRARFDAVIAGVFAEAELEVPRGFVSSGGGRHGVHFSSLGHLLAEMQVLARQHPGASW